MPKTYDHNREAQKFQTLARNASAAYWREDYADAIQILDRMKEHLLTNGLCNNSPQKHKVDR